MARRRLYGPSAAASMRIGQPVPQCADAIHQVHRAAEDRPDRLLGMLVRCEVQSPRRRRVELRKIVLVGVFHSLLVENALADRLEQRTGDCDCAFRIARSATEGFRPHGVHAFDVERFQRGSHHLIAGMVMPALEPVDQRCERPPPRSAVVARHSCPPLS